MNAFKNYSPPNSVDPNEWAESVEQHCRALQGSEGAQQEVQRVLSSVEAAVKSGAVKFLKGDVAEAVNFANWVLDSVRSVDPSFTVWQCPELCPPSVALFVQPNEEGRFSFQPMFTL